MSFKRVPKLIIISVLSVSLLSLGFGSRFVSASSSLTWADQATMTTARTALAVVAAENGLIYAMGGNGSEFVDDQLSTVEAYNPTNNTWATKASMEHIRLAFGAVDYSGLIYVFGGQGAPSDPTALATAEVYTPSTNSWSYIASMPVALSGTQAVVSGGKIYVVGGRHADGSLAANVEQYDPATNTWAQKTSMPTARTEGALATDTSGNIYAIGGFVSDQLKTVQEYNPTTDSWTSRADMPTARGDLGATTVGGIIYAVGGYNRTSNALSVVESYDPSTNTWSTGTSLQHARSGLGVTSTASGDIYAIGGEPVPTPYP